MPRTVRSSLLRSRLLPSRFASGLVAGLLLSVPLALSGSLVGTAATRHLAEATPNAVAAKPVATVAVNREAKSSRLPSARLPVPAASASPVAAQVETRSETATSVVTKGEVPRAIKPRSNATPRGCLSAVGGLAAESATEGMTVCLADISMIQDWE